LIVTVLSWPVPMSFLADLLLTLLSRHLLLLCESDDTFLCFFHSVLEDIQTTCHEKSTKIDNECGTALKTFLERVSERLHNKIKNPDNYDLVLRAVEKDSCALQYASKELRNNLGLVLIAAAENPKAWFCASREIMSRTDVADAVLIKDPELRENECRLIIESLPKSAFSAFGARHPKYFSGRFHASKGPVRHHRPHMEGSDLLEELAMRKN